MQIIILEGISTSGKTSVKNELSKTLTKKDISFSVIGEDKTLMPILENTDKNTSIDFLKRVLADTLTTKKSIIIFDRLFFTHIFRTNSGIKDFKEIENILLKYNTLLVLLTVEEDAIDQRIFEAMKYRDAKWKKFIKRKGTKKEIIDYYKNQQKFLRKLINQSALPNLIEDSTDLNFKRISKNIFEKLNTVI